MLLCNRRFIRRLQVHWWSSIRDVKAALHKLTNEPPSRHHLYHSTNPSELRNSIMLHDIGIEKSGRMLRVAIDYRNEGDFVITPTKDVLLDDASKAMVESVRRGFQRNKPPTATDEFEGSGGVYFLRSAFGSYEAVFKPHDEEQGMPNNPKDRVGTGVEGLREHFQPGQGCLRELAAYIMDYKHFSGVPPTTLVHCEHPTFHYPLPLQHGASSAGRGKPFPKLGSLQKFIRGADLFEDLGPSLLSDFEVQKIALLDIRLLNCDRNAANILVQHTHDSCSDQDSEVEADHRHEFVVSGSPTAGVDMLHQNVYHLVPIDHGYCMPSRLKILEWDWTWFHYAHIRRPVHPDIINYMKALDINLLLRKLTAQVALSDDSVFLLRLSHFLLLEAFAANLTLYDVAVIVARSGDDESCPSRLEQAVAEAEDNAYRSIELKFSRSKTLSPYFSESAGRAPPLAASADPPAGSKHVRHDSETSPLSHEQDTSPHDGALCEDDLQCNCKHALNHSPMRPHLVKTASCNQLVQKPPLMLHVTPRPRLGKDPSPPPHFGQLETIVEAAARRERGLSSLSNQSCESTASSGSGVVLEKDLKGEGDGGCPDSTDIDSVGVSGCLSMSGGGNGAFRGLDEDKGEKMEARDISALEMGGKPLRVLCSVDGHDLIGRTKTRTAAACIRCPPPSPLTAKKQRVLQKAARQEEDEQNLFNALMTTLPDPREFGVMGWPLHPKDRSMLPSASSDAGLDSAPVHSKPALSKSSSSTNADTRSWALFPRDIGDDTRGDYSYFTFAKDDDLADTVDCMEYCPKELSSDTHDDPLMLTSDFLVDVPLPEAIPLARVVSFSGFESNLMYTNQSMRTMGNLRLERRRAIADSGEFKQLRQEFAESQVKSIVQRVAAAKKGGRNM